ncbi:MAG: hypothetical protein AB7N24_04695 [Dehalococcoidia bacterium]
METTASNPVAGAFAGIPTQTVRAASIAGRLFGAGLLIAVAFEQSYDPTQVFTVSLAAMVVATLVPLPGWWGDIVAAFGAGLVFFAGTVLTHLAPGLGMLAMGLLSGLAAFALAHRSGRDAVLPAFAFVAAVAVTAVLQVFLVFNVE